MPQTPSISCHVGKGHRYNDETVRDLQHITEPAKTFLEERIAKPGYSGLSISQMKRLANTLRVAPRDGAEKAQFKPKKQKTDDVTSAYV